MNVTLHEIGRSSLDIAAIISFIGNGVEKLVERGLQATGGMDESLKSKVLESFMTAYEKDKTTLTRPYPGVLKCLGHLQNAGMPMGICTNKPEEPAQDICDVMGLSEYFDVIAGARPDMRKKPDPAPLFAVCKALGAPPKDTLYVGDSVVDFQTAEAGEIPFRLFTRGYLNAPLPDVSSAHRFDDWSRVQFEL